MTGVTIYASWHGASGKWTTGPEDYDRHWALEGPQHEPLYYEGKQIFPDNPPRFSINQNWMSKP